MSEKAEPRFKFNDVCPNCGVRIALLDECGCDDDFVREGGRERAAAGREVADAE